MSLPFSCPSCHAKLKARTEQAGLRVRCPACGAIAAIRTPTAAAPVALPEHLAASPPAALPTPVAVPRAAAVPRPRPRPSPAICFWVSGGAASALLLGAAVVVAVVFWPHPTPTPKPAGVPVAFPAPTSDPPAPVVDKPAGEVRQAVMDGVHLQGSVVFDTRTESSFNSETTYHQWKPQLKLENGTPFPLEFGNDVELIESNADGSAYEGMAVLDDPKPSLVMTPNSLGLFHNYETRSAQGNVETVFETGNTTTIRFGGFEDVSFGSAKAGATWELDRVFEQEMWLRDELRSNLQIVLPELRVRTAGGVERFRLTAFFKKPTGPDDSWTLVSQEITPIQSEPLKKTLASPTTNQVAKVLAANWLAEAYPQEAVGPLVETAKPLPEGQMLGTCLALLTSLSGGGLESHAFDLYQNKKTPNGIRNDAARYLGALRYELALDALIAGTADEDGVVALGSIDALGTFAAPRAVAALLGLLHDDKHSGQRPQIAHSLARTKAPDAVKTLRDLATGGDADALDALIATPVPETFDFVAGMARKAENKDQRDRAVRGLRPVDGDKALAVLLELLEKDDPPPQDNPLELDAVADELVVLNAATATPQLTALTDKGNLRALQVLAGSSNESVQQPLTAAAGKAQGAALHIALDGLMRNWAAKSFDSFAAHLNDPDVKIVGVAVIGLREGKSAKAAALLEPLLNHQESSIRSDVATALAELPCEEAAPRIAEALLASSEPSVVSSLSTALLNAKWKDPKAIHKLGEKLAATPDESTRFELVRLLRSQSGDAMGPKDYDEFAGDAAGWTRKWVDWAAKQ